jgi:murein DD-endopeptidase MepM/ murein hydrolase activator NlpD
MNDPRGSRRLYFHFGIDVSAPDGTPVHAVAPGKVFRQGGRAVAVDAPGGGRTFGYWHIVPAVAHGERVERHQLLGHIAEGWGHVHFAERRPDGYRNPLRRGGIHPFVDRTPPTITSIGFFRRGRAVPPDRVHGTVAIIVEAFDRTPLRVAAPWARLPVTPALIRWRVKESRRIVVPWRTAIDSRFAMLAPERIRDVYASGTRQNHANNPGRYRFYLQREWKSSGLPDGAYHLEVAASDTRGNRTVARLPFTIANKV